MQDMQVQSLGQEDILKKETATHSYIPTSVQFSSVTQSCPILCNPMDCSTQGFPVHHQLEELVQTLIPWVADAIQASHLLSAPSPPAIRVFARESILHIRWPKYWSFSSASVFPMNIQDWFPLGLTAFISLQSKELSRVFSSITVQKSGTSHRQRSLAG